MRLLATVAILALSSLWTEACTAQENIFLEDVLPQMRKLDRAYVFTRGGTLTFRQAARGGLCVQDGRLITDADSTRPYATISLTKYNSERNATEASNDPIPAGAAFTVDRMFASRSGLDSGDYVVTIHSHHGLSLRFVAPESFRRWMTPDEFTRNAGFLFSAARPRN